MTGRSKSSSCLRLLPNETSSETITSPLVPPFPPPSLPYFLEWVKVDDDGGRAALSYREMGQGLEVRYGQGLAMTLIKWLVSVDLVSEPLGKRIRNPRKQTQPKSA